jgi:TPR repeat protein
MYEIALDNLERKKYGEAHQELIRIIQGKQANLHQGSLGFFGEHTQQLDPKLVFQKLGDIYRNGWGVKIDLQKAQYYYQKAQKN